MDVQNIIPPHISIPVLAVIMLVCLVFMFGFRMTSPQPPSFDFDEDSNEKKSRRIRKKKPEKETTNGSISGPKEVRERVTAPVVKNTRVATNENTSPKKAKPVAPKITVTGTAKPKKVNGSAINRAQDVNDREEQEGGEGWITPISKKERKQNKQNAGQKEVTSQGEKSPAKPSPRASRVSGGGDNLQMARNIEEKPGEETMNSNVAPPKQKGPTAEGKTSDVVESEVVEAVSADQQQQEVPIQEVKSTPETLVAATPLAEMDSPSTTSKSSRKKKKAAAAAAAVAEFAETLPSEKAEKPAGAKPDEEMVPAEAAAMPSKGAESPHEEDTKVEDAEEEFTVAKSKKNKKKKGKNASPQVTTETKPIPSSPEPAIPLATTNTASESPTPVKQDSPKKSGGSAKKSNSKKAKDRQGETQMTQASKSNDSSTVKEVLPKPEEPRASAAERLAPEPTSTAGATEATAETNVEATATGGETGDDWVEAKPVKKRKKVRRDV